MCAWTMRPLLPYRDNIRTCKMSIEVARLGEVQRTNRENLMLEMYLASHFGDHQPRQDHELTIYGSVHIHNFVTCYTRTMWKAVRRAKSSRSLQQLCLVGSLRTQYMPLSSSLSRLSKPGTNLHDTSSVSSQKLVDTSLTYPNMAVEYGCPMWLPGDSGR